ncbi:3-hexulose-6-phosphate synthase [Periweissella cryptocerci]|uniref:3-hexulose-6-phosphate synthase n=1 Tax=Periweissella cryptocerci TaxID=2506420 RepID=A0A4P6YRB3_9LACO|nr:orotidine 5'-phosphate decarboxylase / HUMPS family protein [Periweissella cryptocerci]QBO35132.1 3-hexulose-6-phosphate synthase [Periweissella cryptocerci]
MKLQVAIDRVSLAEALKLALLLDSEVDIIEFGTSLVKDYGLYALQDVKAQLKHAQVLFDLKTIDEGVYEFEKGYAVNADILTVMAGSAKDTLTKVYEVAERENKEMLIDLMETDDTKLVQITDYEHAIYGLHHSHDREDLLDAAASVADFHEKYPNVKRIAIAGGIDLENAKKLAAQGLTETVIVGSKILKATDPIAAAHEFKEALK